jgi:hypothetical protein
VTGSPPEPWHRGPVFGNDPRPGAAHGFSDRPRERFVSARVPALWLKFMTRLGYERFAGHGGGITARLGQQFPEHLVGIHVTTYGG